MQVDNSFTRLEFESCMDCYMDKSDPVPLANYVPFFWFQFISGPRLKAKSCAEKKILVLLPILLKVQCWKKISFFFSKNTEYYLYFILFISGYFENWEEPKIEVVLLNSVSLMWDNKFVRKCVTMLLFPVFYAIKRMIYEWVSIKGQGQDKTFKV